jgi:uncharacterized membrane protein
MKSEGGDEMVTAAKTVSRVATHMVIAFALAWGMTGSIALGGLAAVVEPIVNVVLLPLHERLWRLLHARFLQTRPRYLALGAEKLSQTGMHIVVAFGVLAWASGSIAFGGMAALIEPVVNVVVLPFHDRAWERLRRRVELMRPRAGFAA